MRLTLRAQMAAVTLLLVLGALLATGYCVQEQLRAALIHEVELRGLTTARHLAGSSADFLMSALRLETIFGGTRHARSWAAMAPPPRKMTIIRISLWIPAH